MRARMHSPFITVCFHLLTTRFAVTTDSHTSVSGYTEATVGPALEYFPVTSTDTSQPQPSAGSDHVPPKTSPTLQYITAPTDKAAPPPDGTKDGHEKHSKRNGLDISGSAHGDNGSLFTRSNTLEDDSFVSQYILARRHDLQVRRVSPPTLRELYSVRHGYSGDVAYSQRVGVVVVPGLYQMEPYVYNSDVPAYFSYGTVGALLASQVAKIMHPNYAGVRQSGSWWARDTHDRYSRRIRCLVDLHYRLGFKDHVAGSPQEQQATMYTVVQGLRLAFDSMEADFRDHAPNYGVFSAYWPEAVRIFFMRYCLLWCSASQRPNPLTPREMCLLPVHNMPEFAEAFGCSKSARYVKGRCRM
ncbi:uncharacterized protein LOC119403124 [Rhipicephalus sanguineus]|uniref:uncharacterized protein LOC119403124 n=1 Tax=Rhipicephalus sanguineus TaxID=34632 RepID=UPI0018960612|nr:uncharacterized protein LOC119403124 [Rhipicephalus sanguineus]